LVPTPRRNVLTPEVVLGVGGGAGERASGRGRGLRGGSVGHRGHEHHGVPGLQGGHKNNIRGQVK
jgi:hypothetical protein